MSQCPVPRRSDPRPAYADISELAHDLDIVIGSLASHGAAAARRAPRRAGPASGDDVRRPSLRARHASELSRPRTGRRRPVRCRRRLRRLPGARRDPPGCSSSKPSCAPLAPCVTRCELRGSDTARTGDPRRSGRSGAPRGPGNRAPLRDLDGPRRERRARSRRAAQGSGTGHAGSPAVRDDRARHRAPVRDDRRSPPRRRRARTAARPTTCTPTWFAPAGTARR